MRYLYTRGNIHRTTEDEAGFVGLGSCHPLVAAHSSQFLLRSCKIDKEYTYQHHLYTIQII